MKRRGHGDRTAAGVAMATYCAVHWYQTCRGTRSLAATVAGARWREGYPVINVWPSRGHGGASSS